MPKLLVEKQPKSTDATQACFLGVSSVAGAWRECDFKNHETYASAAMTTPPHKLSVRLDGAGGGGGGGSYCGRLYKIRAFG